MTLTSSTVRLSYNGDGATTSFSVTFVFWEKDDLRVILRDADGAETVWTRGTEYTVTGGDGSTGTVEVETSPTDFTPASGETLVILSNVPNTQLTSFPLGGPFPSTAAEQELDKTNRRVQQQEEELGRSLKFSETSPDSGVAFPDVTGNASKVPRVKSDASGLEMVGVETFDGLTVPVETGDLAGFYDTRSDITTASIASGTNFIRTAGYATVGDGGGALYKRVGAEPSHNLKAQSSDGAWWEIAEPAFITFQACGGVEGDSAANGAGNVTAFNDFIGYLQDSAASGFVKGPTLFFPVGDYHFNAHLNVKAVVHMMGPAGWHTAANDGGPRFKFPADTHGIIVHRANTLDDTTAASTYGADGSVIENISVEGGGAGNTTGHGFWVRAFCTIRHCDARDFAENGFNVVGEIGAGGSSEGNPSFFKIEHCQGTGNGKSGCYINGADANAGHTLGCDFRENGRWGLDDSSFLGNSHVANHESSNGGDTNGGNSGTSCVADFGGSSYLLNVDASEADAVATQPGTDRGVWIENPSASGGIAWSGGLPEGTYHHGGGYKSIGTQARTTFLGCYTEPGKGSQLKKPTLWLGGHETFDTYGNHGGFAPDVNKTRMRGSYQLEAADSEWPLEPASGAEVTMLLNWNRQTMIGLKAPSDAGNGVELAQWDNSAKMWQVAHGSDSALKFSTSLTTRTYGRASAIGKGLPALESGVFLGDGTGARHMTNATAAPSSGEVAQGEIIWDRSAGAGGKAGFFVTTGGTAGSTAVTKPFAAIDA